MNKRQIYIFILFFLTGCSKNNPIMINNFKALRCESNIKEQKYKDYIFDENNGYLYFYDQIKNKFIPISQRFESRYFSENTREIFSIIRKNNLVIENIEYFKDSDENQRYIKKQDIINLRSLRKRSIYKNKKGENIISRGKCTWIDPKLGLRY